MKKYWLFLLMLVGIFMISGAVAAFGGDKAPKVPKELQNLPLFQVLAPDPDSEVVLDEVVVINAPGGKGQTVGFSVFVPPDEEAGDIELKVDPVRGTYKATKKKLNFEEIEQMEMEMQQMDQMNQDYQQLNQNQNRDKDMTLSYSTTVTISYTRAAAIQTEDPVNWALCKTTQRLYWYSDTGVTRKGISYRYVWGATPTPAGTNWYNGGWNNYPLTVGDTYMTSRFWAWYYNWDFLDGNVSTTVAHDLYIYGYYNGSALIVGNAYYNGEAWWLLHSHVRWWL